jgi:hypothetical protein
LGVLLEIEACAGEGLALGSPLGIPKQYGRQFVKNDSFYQSLNVDFIKDVKLLVLYFATACKDK